MKRLGLAVLALAVGCVPPAPHLPTPPETFRLQVYVQDQASAPLPSARVYRDNAAEENPRDGGTPLGVGADGGRAWGELPPSGFNVCALAEGYETTCEPAPLTEDLIVTIRLPLASVPPAPIPEVFVFPPAQPREALPPFPVPTGEDRDGRFEVWSFDQYEDTFKWDPPDGKSRSFHRGNFMPTIEGCDLPELDSGAPGHPEVTFTWDFARYAPEQRECYLRKYAAAGYTQFEQSIPQARNHGVLDDRLIESHGRVKDAGFYSVIVAFGGDGESWDEVRNWLDRLQARAPIDEVLVCWQCDRAYSDPWELLVHLVEVSDWAAPHGIEVGMHWITRAGAWPSGGPNGVWDDDPNRPADDPPDDDPRRPSTCRDATSLGLSDNICDRWDYMRVLAGRYKYVWLQQDVNAPIADEREGQGGLQGEIRDVLRSLVDQKLVVAEYDQQRRFDNPDLVPEAEGDLKGLLLLMTSWQGRVVEGGFMGGARSADGSYVH